LPGSAERSGNPVPRIALTYLLGNLAPVLQRRDDRSPVWAGIGVGAVLIWALHLAQWPAIQNWLAGGALSLPLWLGMLLGVSLAGLLAGARALFRTASETSFIVSRLPLWLRHPKAIGLLGFVIPGAGLLCTGHAWKAAFAYVNAGLTGLALFALLHWNDLWEIHQQAGATGLSPTPSRAPVMPRACRTASIHWDRGGCCRHSPCSCSCW
jgi:hypothetical protein